METMKPTLKRGRTVWDKINMPEAEFRERVEKIQKDIKKEGIDLLLIYGSSPDDYGGPCYMSNYVGGMDRSLVMIPQQGQAVLVYEGPSRGLPSVKSITWIEEVKPCGDISKECVKYLRENKFIPSTIGFVGMRQLMPYYQLQFLYESVGQSKIVDADHIIRDMRMVKSQRECDQIRRASRIVTYAFDFISDVYFENTNERIIEAMVDREVRLEGVEDFRMLIAKPTTEGWTFRPVENVNLSTGDNIIIYLAVEFERYWSEGIRTFEVESSRLVQPELKNAKVLYEQIMRSMKPGKALSLFYKQTISKLNKNKVHYIPEYGLGQGIGLSLQESPVVTEGEASCLKKGMCLSLRLTIKEKRLGAIMIGNTVHLSRNGPEILTQ